MSYECLMRGGECDGCMDCMGEAPYACCQCGRDIYEDEVYYRFFQEAMCAACVEEHRRRA